MPRALEFAFVLGITLQFMSESTKLFEVLYYWDKLVHPTLVALTGMVAAWLLIGYRDAFGKHMPIHLVAAFGMLLGIAVGAVWEFIEFASDWFGNADLQKSNGDTITDIISNNTGAFAGDVAGAVPVHPFLFRAATPRHWPGSALAVARAAAAGATLRPLLGAWARRPSSASSSWRSGSIGTHRRSRVA